MGVGQDLREARLQRGLDLYEAKRVTGIDVSTLRAMEEDRWDAVPDSEAESLLATYADFLGLDEPPQLPEPSRAKRQHRERIRPAVLVVLAAAAVGVILGLVGLGQLGGSGNGGRSGVTKRVLTQTTTTPSPTSPVSVQITTHALVWVCLVDQRGRPVVNGQDLVRGQTVGPFEGKSFLVAFGNGKVDLTVNGEPVDVSPIASPSGYRITPQGTTRLAPSERPTCT